MIADALNKHSKPTAQDVLAVLEKNKRLRNALKAIGRLDEYSKIPLTAAGCLVIARNALYDQ
jgi:hypothetical protein